MLIALQVASVPTRPNQCFNITQTEDSLLLPLFLRFLTKKTNCFREMSHSAERGREEKG